MSRIGGSGWVSDAQRQWQPTLTVHEPGTTLSLESPLGDQPYQTGVRSRRPFTGVIFGRGREGAAVTAAKAVAFAVVSLVADRTAYARPRDASVTFQRAPVVASAPDVAKAAAPTVASLAANRQAVARRTARVISQHAPSCPSVTFDAVSSASGNGTNTVTWSHTTSGTNRYLTVLVSSYFADGEVTGVTYNGVALTLIGAYATTDPRQSIWGLIAPATGANNVTVTFAGPASANGWMSAISFNNVHQGGAATGPFAANAGISSSQSVTSPETEARGMIVSIVGDYSGSAITISSGTTRASAPSFNHMQSATQIGVLPTTSWTTPGSDTWTASAVLIKPVQCVSAAGTRAAIILAERVGRRVRIVSQRAPVVAAVAADAKAAPSTVVGARARKRPVSRVTFLHNPAVDGNTRPRAGQITVATLVPERAARRPRPDVVFLRNPQAPAASPAAKAMPFTVVSQMSVQRARVTARPTGEIAQTPPPDVRPVPHIVSLVGKRIARPRPTGRVVFQRESPANFDADGSIPITTVVQQSRAFFRRPTSRVSFLRNPLEPVAAPAVKAVPAKIASLVTDRRATVRREGGATFLRSFTPYAKPVPARVVSLVAERRAAVRRTGEVVFSRTFFSYYKGTQPVIATLIPERTARRPHGSVFTSRAPFIHVKAPPPPVIATLVPERAARRPRGGAYFRRNALVPITGSPFPAYIVYENIRTVVFAASARDYTAALEGRAVVVLASPLNPVTTLPARATVFKLDSMR